MPPTLIRAYVELAKVLSDWLRNTVRYEEYENGYAPNVALLKQGSCDAAVVSASFYDNQKGAADKAAVKGIHNTLPLPGVLVTAGPRLTPCRSTPCAATLRSLGSVAAQGHVARGASRGRALNAGQGHRAQGSGRATD